MSSSFFTRTASGGVICLLVFCAPAPVGAAEITLGDYALRADEIIIDDSTETITAVGSAGIRGKDGQMTANTITITADAEWKMVESADAQGEVRFEFVSTVKDAEGTEVTRRLSGTCELSEWNRDPEWKGQASADKGIVNLKGSVHVNVKSEGSDQTTGEIACETMVLYLNQGRYVAKGGPGRRAELMLDFPEESKARGVD